MNEWEARLIQVRICTDRTLASPDCDAVRAMETDLEPMLFIEMPWVLE